MVGRAQIGDVVVEQVKLVLDATHAFNTHPFAFVEDSIWITLVHTGRQTHLSKLESYASQRCRIRPSRRR